MTRGSVASRDSCLTGTWSIALHTGCTALCVLSMWVMYHDVTVTGNQCFGVFEHACVVCRMILAPSVNGGASW